MPESKKWATSATLRFIEIFCYNNYGNKIYRCFISISIIFCRFLKFWSHSIFLEWCFVYISSKKLCLSSSRLCILTNCCDLIKRIIFESIYLNTGFGARFAHDTKAMTKKIWIIFDDLIIRRTVKSVIVEIQDMLIFIIVRNKYTLKDHLFDRNKTFLFMFKKLQYVN